MPSPFPGMNPFLEDPYFWQSFHTMLLAAIQRQLSQNLPPGFVSRPEQRVYILPDERDVRPDVTVFATAKPPVVAIRGSVATLERETPPEHILLPLREITDRYLEIRDNRSGGREVIATIELLSPVNKDDNGGGQQEYRKKQRALLNSQSHLVEIDLLRGGAHTVFIPKAYLRSQGDYDYVVTLADSTRPGEGFFWRIGLRDLLPTIHIPLTEDVSAVKLDLQEAFADCWEENRLDADIDYNAPLKPPLKDSDSEWVRMILANHVLFR